MNLLTLDGERYVDKDSPDSRLLEVAPGFPVFRLNALSFAVGERLASGHTASAHCVVTV